MPELTDWSRYRKCPVCFAPLEQPCTTLSGGVAFVESPVQVDRDRPHTRRPLRTGYARTEGDR
jgi:hypothetical protein